jgi:hypothetical protein
VKHHLKNRVVWSHMLFSKVELNLAMHVRRAYYKYMSSLIEPWDGPALIAFTDGEVGPAPPCKSLAKSLALCCQICILR